jgi:hypothetical protein
VFICAAPNPDTGRLGLSGIGAFCPRGRALSIACFPRNGAVWHTVPMPQAMYRFFYGYRNPVVVVA